MNVQSLLEKLQIRDVNAGTCAGPGEWLADADARKYVSINPATGEPIATVQLASEATFDRVVDGAVRAFAS